MAFKDPIAQRALHRVAITQSAVTTVTGVQTTLLTVHAKKDTSESRAWNTMPALSLA